MKITPKNRKQFASNLIKTQPKKLRATTSRFRHQIQFSKESDKKHGNMDEQIREERKEEIEKEEKKLETYENQMKNFLKKMDAMKTSISQV